MNSLKYIEIDHFELNSGRSISLKLSYQDFGRPLHKAPIVLVNHALTGNSQVTGANGWWNAIVGKGKIIDTSQYTILSFNIPGNGFGKTKEHFVEYYKEFTAKDIARLFAIGLQSLQVSKLFAVIGGSVGGGIAWELASLRPKLAEHIIPIASDWKATDWLIANCFVQERILENSLDPIADARLHAMTFYRTPESLSEKFNRTKADRFLHNVETWLNHHGEKLSRRFQISAYKMMNQILKTINVADHINELKNVVRNIEGSIHIITINTDLFFKPEENWNTFVELKSIKKNVTIGEIKSVHGHDAFLIEYQQLSKLLVPIFKQKLSIDDRSQLNYIRNR
ncbi:alpha/beta fold hydrolase [Winogradskyella haliclonae]|uniref:Homoserine O-acetyltransferase n=1 Tax=Winogradskyella haliclonae TaxID=2048558 RepID=A0ABQ2BY05_9FLAO|nr:alpha/beta fold hydrolase [Winogradskyella haliclonae]GGI55793.1 homoserine O-acetyltransferase [Winogradskyella haliclonae]